MLLTCKRVFACLSLPPPFHPIPSHIPPRQSPHSLSASLLYTVPSPNVRKEGDDGSGGGGGGLASTLFFPPSLPPYDKHIMKYACPSSSLPLSAACFECVTEYSAGARVSLVSTLSRPAAAAAVGRFGLAAQQQRKNKNCERTGFAKVFF